MSIFGLHRNRRREKILPNGEKSDDSKDDKDKNGKKLPPWLNKKKSKGQDYSELYRKVTDAEYGGPLKVGDNVKNINPKCSHYKSEGVVKKFNKVRQRPGDLDKLAKRVDTVDLELS